MPDQDPSTEEFRTFIRDLGVRAFDQLASGFEAAGDAVSRRAQSMAKLAGTWNKMAEPDKETFFDQLIDAAQRVAAAAPGLIGLGKPSRTKPAADAPEKKQTRKKTTASNKKKSK